MLTHGTSRGSAIFSLGNPPQKGYDSTTKPQGKAAVHTKTANTKGPAAPRLGSVQREWYAVLAALAVTALAFYALNILTCLHTDDFSYTYTFAVKEGKYRISNLYQLFLSQRNHYRVMNGRAVVHTLAQLFLMWGKPVFDLLNTAAFLALGVLIYRHASPTGAPLRPLLLLAPFALLWGTAPAFGESFLWLVGACNYLFSILIILLALLPVTRALDRGFAPAAWWKSALYFFPCLLAGWTNENNSVAFVVILLCCAAGLLIARRRPPAWLWLGLAGSVAGCLLLLLSPGQAVRLAGQGGFGGLGVWVGRGLAITKRLFFYLWLPLVLSAAAFIHGLRDKRPVSGLLRPGLFCLAGLAATYSMILSPAFPPRAWSGPVVFFSITLLALWRWAFPAPWEHKRLAAGLTALTLLLAAGSYVYGARDLLSTRRAFQAREAYIAQELAAGRREVSLSPIYGHTRWNCYGEDGDLGDDPTQWPNTAYAMYYGLTQVSKAE